MPAVRADGFEAVAMLKPIIADRTPSSEGLTPLAVPLSVERHREWRFRSDAPKSSGRDCDPNIVLATELRPGTEAPRAKLGASRLGMTVYDLPLARRSARGGPEAGGLRALDVRREPFGQLQRSAQRDVVAAVDLIGLDPEALAGVTARPRR
jgi:hypothetical protein